MLSEMEDRWQGKGAVIPVEAASDHKTRISAFLLKFGSCLPGPFYSRLLLLMGDFSPEEMASVSRAVIIMVMPTMAIAPMIGWFGRVRRVWRLPGDGFLGRGRVVNRRLDRAHRHVGHTRRGRAR